MQNKVYHKVEQITGNVIVIKASNVIAGELAQVDSNNNLSLAHKKNGDIEKAIKIYEKALEIKSDNYSVFKIIQGFIFS